MKWLTGALNTIITLGAIQGFIAGALLYWGKRNRKANRYLAFMIWFFSLACVNLRLFQESALYTTTLGGFIGAFVPLMFIMPLGPLFYFYIRASLEPSFQWKKQYRWHWSSTLLDLAPQLAAVIYISGIVFGLIKTPIPLGEYIDAYNVYVDMPRWLSLTLYLLVSYRLLRAHGAHLPPAGGQDQPVNVISLRWLQQFIRVFLGFQALWLLFLIPYELPGNSERLLAAVGWYPIYVPLALLIYWVGLKALLVTYSIPLALPVKQVATNPLPAETVDNTLAQLKKAMEQEQLFLDPELNLAALSQHIGVAPKTISAVLNQHQQTSFNEFVNSYRIRAFQQKMLQADLQHLTLTSIAFDCGFNSQATFQRSFKQATGMSPTAYRKAAVQG